LEIRGDTQKSEEKILSDITLRKTAVTLDRADVERYYSKVQQIFVTFTAGLTCSGGRISTGIWHDGRSNREWNFDKRSLWNCHRCHTGREKLQLHWIGQMLRDIILRCSKNVS